MKKKKKHETKQTNSLVEEDVCCMFRVSDQARLQICHTVTRKNY